MSTSIFFYGLFMDADVLRSKGLHPENRRQACVHGMALRIGNRATLVPDTSQAVYGIVMDLSSEELEHLYAEPSVAEYRAETVIAKDGLGNSISAICYNLPSAPDPSELNIEYATKLRTLARRLGLPDHYVASIR